MKNNNPHHVVPDPKGGWNVKKSGANKASAHFERKEDAVSAARVISRNQGTELFVHNQNGRIGFKDSHGNAPFPPRG